MSEYVDPFEGGDDVAPHPGPGHTGQAPKRREAPDLIKAAGLVPASSLLPPDADQDMGDFEPGGRYKGFEILPREQEPIVEFHQHIAKRFYVRFGEYVGLVPWPGSTIIWPWERAWVQDLHRTEVQSFLKEEKEVKKRG